MMSAQQKKISSLGLSAAVFTKGKSEHQLIMPVNKVMDKKMLYAQWDIFQPCTQYLDMFGNISGPRGKPNAYARHIRKDVIYYHA